MKWNQSILIKSTLLFAVLVGYWSCDKGEVIEERNWKLVWEDNFDGPAGQAPDAANWVFDVGTGPGNDGWGNAELQYYTDRPDNAALDGEGNLAITARRESYSGRAFTSARLKTQGVFDQAYGRFEARIKMPWGPGIWPAFWLLGSDIDVVGWPQCGEIDIMEYRGQQPNLIHGTVHGPGYSGGAAITKSFGFANDRFDLDFHLFAVEWTEEYIDFFVDDVRYQRIRQGDVPGEWVYDQPFFIILNVAVGGNYVGFPTDQTPFPQTMLVDWVRVFEEMN
jgi:beta-glucanase (GH16 family)